MTEMIRPCKQNEQNKDIKKGTRIQMQSKDDPEADSLARYCNTLTRGERTGNKSKMKDCGKRRMETCCQSAHVEGKRCKKRRDKALHAE
jgi:hypothetical protein